MTNLEQKSKQSFLNSDFLILGYYLLGIYLSLRTGYFIMPLLALLSILALISYFSAKKHKFKLAQAHFWRIFIKTLDFVLYYAFMQVLYVGYFRYIAQVNFWELFLNYDIWSVLLHYIFDFQTQEYTFVIFLHILTFCNLFLYLFVAVYGLYQFSLRNLPNGKKCEPCELNELNELSDEPKLEASFSNNSVPDSKAELAENLNQALAYQMHKELNEELVRASLEKNQKVTPTVLSSKCLVWLYYACGFCLFFELTPYFVYMLIPFVFITYWVALKKFNIFIAEHSRWILLSLCVSTLLWLLLPYDTLYYLSGYGLDNLLDDTLQNMLIILTLCVIKLWYLYRIVRGMYKYWQSKLPALRAFPL